MSGVDYVFVVVVGSRFLLPLLIPRYPLTAVIGCLLLDGVDQTIFQAFGYDPPGYQSYDKAMDVYYLAIAYLATMRNWASLPAYDVGRFLYFYRLVGVVVFELSQVRAMLLVFPNTFEYFFIAYETVRTRWRPLRVTLKWWVITAAAIWIFVVLPRLPEPDWDLRLPADPLPEAINTAAEQAAWRATSGRVVSWVTLEKVVLVGLISIIYAQTLPGIHATNLELFVFIAVFVVLNTAIGIAFARRGRSIESATLAVLARLLVDVVIVVVARWLAGSDSSSWNVIFFLGLISLITTLHDRWQPVLAYRRSTPTSSAGPVAVEGAGA